MKELLFYVNQKQLCISYFDIHWLIPMDVSNTEYKVH